MLPLMIYTPGVIFATVIILKQLYNKAIINKKELGYLDFLGVALILFFWSFWIVLSVKNNWNVN